MCRKALTTLGWLPFMLVIATAQARGDEPVSGGQTLRGITITGYRDGVVRVRMGGGEPQQVPVWGIESFELAKAQGMDDLNYAESLVRAGELVQAIGYYERSLRNAREFWPGLIRARLLMAADRAGLFATSVPLFVKLAQQDPVVAAHLLPRGLPMRGGDAVARAMEQVNELLLGDIAANTRILLQLLRFDVLRSASDPAAKELAMAVVDAPLPPDLVTERTVAAKCGALRVLIDDGRIEEARRAIEGLMSKMPREHLPGLLLLKSRALLAAAKRDDEFLAAALPAMRVAIHYPDRPEACEGLLLAAEAHADSGRKEDALRLLRACLAKSQATEEVKTRARQRVTELTGAADAGGGTDCLSVEPRDGRLASRAVLSFGGTTRPGSGGIECFVSA